MTLVERDMRDDIGSSNRRWCTSHRISRCLANDHAFSGGAQAPSAATRG
jgi:hypothetical protein